MAGCPKCGFVSGEASECPRCGVVFARWRDAQAKPAAAAAFEAFAPPSLALEPMAAAPAAALPVERQGWMAYGGGLAAALIVLAFPLAHFVFSYFTILVHEMGHAATGWLFGYPSVPAFDFAYGGGITLQQDRVQLLVVGFSAAGAWAVYALREHPSLRVALAALLGLYLLLAATSAHEAVIVAMGHGGELFFATLFLHRALSGRGCVTPGEQPLYGLLGWFIVLSDIAFAWQLRTSSFHREMYEDAKGGGHWMDFSRLAEEFLHVRLEAIATVFLVLCLLPPLLAVLVQRLRRD